MPDARLYHKLISPFPMKRGGQLIDASIAYETWGTLDTERSNALLILPGMSPNAHAAANEADPSDGWWQEMIGPGKPIDTTHFFVICINSLGSDKGSTGPASINPETGEPYRLDFPALSLEDVAASAHDLVQRGLGIDKLNVLVGCSMGGMSSLAYLLKYPGQTQHHISVNTAAQAQPFAIAIRSLQREAIRLDKHWNDGHYNQENFPETGMSIARKLGVITYRSALEWNGRFARIRLDSDQQADEPFAFEFQIESYLEYHARRFNRKFDPNCYLYLSRASDWFDIAEYGQGQALQALTQIQLDKALVIGTNTDILFPLEQQKEIVKGLRAGGAYVDFAKLDSPQGHDAFLVDIDNYGQAIRQFLATL